MPEKNGRDHPDLELIPAIDSKPPPRPVPGATRRLERFGDYGEMARSYATLAHEQSEDRKSIYLELDQLRAAVITVDSRYGKLPAVIDASVRKAIAAERELLRAELQGRIREVAESVPDADEIEDAARRGAREGAAEATGPHARADVDAITPNRLEARLLRAEYDKEVAVRKALEDRLRERDARSEKSTEKRWDRVWALAVPIFAGAVLAVAGLVYGAVTSANNAAQRDRWQQESEQRGRALGRAENAPPAVTVQVPMPVPASASPAAPAAVAPRRP